MEEEKLRLRYNELDDMAVTTASAFLGLTLGCAAATTTSTTPSRPAITTGCNAPSRRPRASEVLLATEPRRLEISEQESPWKEQSKAAETELNGWLTEQKKPHDRRLAECEDRRSDDRRRRQVTPEGSARLGGGKKLAKQHEKALAISDDDYRRAFADEQRRRWDALEKAIEAVKRSEPQRPPTALPFKDRPTPEPTWLFDRGDFCEEDP